MVRITEDMIRKRAEHNEMEISTLEEVSLHQHDIERIEHLDKWCRLLKILYLQSNLIPKIENVGRLKKLEYLNLALNNIERVENLEGCESLKKLDLTVNFVGELTSIECLKKHFNFEELYLTGNPCTEYEHYREFVIATLPQLKILDGKEVEKSERIKAIQNLGIIRPRIIEQQENYKKKRAKQKAEAEQKEKEEEERKRKDEEVQKNTQNKAGFDGRWYTDINDSEKRKLAEEQHQKKVDQFWQEKTSYTPESRLATHKHLKEMKERDENKDKEKEEKKPRQLFAKDGRPYNVNENKLDFTLSEDMDGNSIILDLAVFRHLDTSMMDCDIQPTYVRVTMKGKIFQLSLPQEVNPDKSSAKRSQTTGHLVLTMPKAKQLLKPKQPEIKQDGAKIRNEKQSRQLLEVDSSARKGVDIGNIVSDTSSALHKPLDTCRQVQKMERPNSDSFVDNPDVPPLI